MLDILLAVLCIILGFAVITKSASFAVNKIILISKSLGVSEFVISFVFAGILATFPELMISVISAFSGKPVLGAGVLIGSNIADMTIIAGTVAIATKKIKIHDHTFGELNKLLIFISLPFILFLDGNLSRIDGIVLVVAFVLYLFFVVLSKKNGEKIRVYKKKISFWKEGCMLAGAVFVVIVSANLIAVASEDLSSYLSIPLFLVGIMVAIGTCLPEMSLALEASAKKHGDIGLGNILGNVFADALLILGIISIIHPIIPANPILSISAAFIMMFALITLVVLTKSEKTLTREEGIFLVFLYFVFLAVQFGIEMLAKLL